MTEKDKKLFHFQQSRKKPSNCHIHWHFHGQHEARNGDFSHFFTLRFGYNTLLKYFCASKERSDAYLLKANGISQTR